jgi:hypothetical protein
MAKCGCFPNPALGKLPLPEAGTTGTTDLLAPRISKFPSYEEKKTSSAALNIDHVHISVYISPKYQVLI